MTDALDDIRFLADSAHRPVVLDALADDPCSRAELRDATGASSATVGRIIRSFEERGWLVREQSTYSLTRLGTFVARRFAALHRDMETARELNELLPRVPVAEIGIDVDDLADAIVTRATHENPFAVVSRVRELELNSAEAYSLTDFFPEPCIDGRYEAIVDGTQAFEAVFAPIVVERAMASDADSAEKFAAIVAADRTNVYVYDGEIDHPVMFQDGEGCLIVRDDENVTIGLIETDEAAVVDWARMQFERYRADATLLAPGDLQTPLDEVLARA
jgi:predicted transcriptional regulator